jgi:hypothetical protein
MKTNIKHDEVTCNESSVHGEKVPDSRVVSNDASMTKPKSTITAVVPMKLSLPTLAGNPTYLDALSYVKELKKVRNKWESTLSKASNDALYEILAECLTLLMNPDVYDIESSIRRCIEDECKKSMSKMQRNTTLEAKIVRVVFDNMYNRRRVHSYAVVLQEAKRQKVTPAMLAEWIRLYGGCSGQLIPDSGLDGFSAFAGGTPSLKVCGLTQL